jgi:hypothetical protein
MSVLHNTSRNSGQLSWINWLNDGKMRRLVRMKSNWIMRKESSGINDLYTAV